MCIFQLKFQSFQVCTLINCLFNIFFMLFLLILFCVKTLKRSLPHLCLMWSFEWILPSTMACFVTIEAFKLLQGGVSLLHLHVPLCPINEVSSVKLVLVPEYSSDLCPCSIQLHLLWTSQIAYRCLLIIPVDKISQIPLSFFAKYSCALIYANSTYMGFAIKFVWIYPNSLSFLLIILVDEFQVVMLIRY